MAGAPRRRGFEAEWIGTTYYVSAEEVKDFRRENFKFNNCK